jgi:hypothetical protein
LNVTVIPEILVVEISVASDGGVALRVIVFLGIVVFYAKTVPKVKPIFDC